MWLWWHMVVIVLMERGHPALRCLKAQRLLAQASFTWQNRRPQNQNEALWPLTLNHFYNWKLSTQHWHKLIRKGAEAVLPLCFETQLIDNVFTSAAQQWLSYTSIHALSGSFPWQVITGYWMEFPLQCSRTLLFIHSIYNSLSFTNTALSWWTGLRNPMKLWAMPCRATQDRQVIVKSSEKMWSSRGGKSKPLQYSCHENPMNSM